MRIRPRSTSPVLPKRKRKYFSLIMSLFAAGVVFFVLIFISQIPASHNLTQSNSTLFELSLQEPQFEELIEQQKKAEQRGISRGSELPDLPATLKVEKQTYPVKVRLHGKNIYHFEKSEKFSIRVNVEGSEFPLGLREFSFIVPNARDNLFHFALLEFLRNQNILVPKTLIAQVSINGNNRGQYFVEEVISSKLPARQGRQDGAVVYVKGQRNCNSLDWAAHFCRGLGTPGSEFPSAAIVGEFKRKYNVTSEKKALHESAVKKFEAARKGETSVSAAFNQKKMADYLAILVLFGASEFDYNDMAFFYDSKEEKFEPIGKHVHVRPRPGQWWVNELFDRQAEFVNLFLGDEGFLEAFLRSLNKWVQPGYLELALKKVLPTLPLLDPQEKYEQAKLGTSLSSVNDDLLAQRDWLKAELDPAIPIQAYLKRPSSESPGLLIYNVQKIPVRIKAIKYLDKQGRTSFLKKLNLSPLWWKNTVRQGRDRSLFIPIDTKQLVPKRLRVVFEVMGTSIEREIEPYFWENELDTRPNEKNALLSDEYFKLQPNEKRATIQGKVEIPQKVVVPAGWTLMVDPGAHLVFKENGRLISFSPLVAEGTEALPIQIESKKKAESLPLIQIKAPKRKSIMRHVNCFSQVEVENLSLTSPAFLSIEGAGIQLKQSNFFHIPYSSVLRIQDGVLEAEGLQFYDLPGSALHAERSRLSLTDVFLYKIRQNGISVSKSKVALQNLRASRIEGTVFEALDLSDTHLWDVEVDRVKRALVAEAASQIKVKNFDIRKTSQGLVVNSGSISQAASRIIAKIGYFEEVPQRYLTDNNSLLSVDATFIRP